MSDVTIKCFRCGKSYPTTDMRFKSSSNNDLICKYCLSKNTTPQASAVKQPKPMEPVKNTEFAMRPQKVVSNPTIDTVNEYKCGKCGYSFKRKKSADVTSCPYCGVEGKLQMKTAKSANSLINDSMRYG